MSDKPEAKKKKRELKECPYCHNHYGNVQNHIKMVHSAEAKAEGRETEPIVSKESLLGGKEKPPIPPSPEDKIYYCQNCQAKLRKGEESCWNCGQAMNWEGVK